MLAGDPQEHELVRETLRTFPDVERLKEVLEDLTIDERLEVCQTLQNLKPGKQQRLVQSLVHSDVAGKRHLLGVLRSKDSKSSTGTCTASNLNTRRGSSDSNRVLGLGLENPRHHQWVNEKGGTFCQSSPVLNTTPSTRYIQN